MSFDRQRGSESAASTHEPSGGGGASAGRLTLTSLLPAEPTGGGGGGSTGKAEYGAGEVRASIGNLAEGSHPGVKRGGGGKRRIGQISGGTFVPAAGGEQQAQPGAAPASPTAATGHEAERAFVGGGSSHAADRTTNDGSTSVRMEDENDAQAAMIAAAVTRARELLDNAIGRLGSPSDPRVAAALQANFHSTEARVVTEVTSKLQRIRSAFDGTIPIEVESEGTSRAYVYVIWSDIHLCPPWFNDPDPDGRARTIIHECSHKYTGTDDEAYHWDTANYAGLSVKDALDNADSYAWFCIDVR
jgi:hypothetical protein